MIACKPSVENIPLSKVGISSNLPQAYTTEIDYFRGPLQSCLGHAHARILLCIKSHGYRHPLQYEPDLFSLLRTAEELLPIKIKVVPPEFPIYSCSGIIPVLDRYYFPIDLSRFLLIRIANSAACHPETQ